MLMLDGLAPWLRKYPSTNDDSKTPDCSFIPPPGRPPRPLLPLVPPLLPPQLHSDWILPLMRQTSSFLLTHQSPGALTVHTMAGNFTVNGFLFSNLSPISPSLRLRLKFHQIHLYFTRYTLKCQMQLSSFWYILTSSTHKSLTRHVQSVYHTIRKFGAPWWPLASKQPFSGFVGRTGPASEKNELEVEEGRKVV